MAPLEALFLPAAFTSTTGLTIPYRLLDPRGSAVKGRYPLVLHLHGSGAIGSDNRSQLAGYAASWATAERRARFPAFVLTPQFSARTAEYFTDDDGMPASRALPHLDAVLELVDSLRRTLPIDSTRIYVVGYSMGGSTAWHALLRRPRLFAAAYSIAGIPPARTIVEAISNVPLLLTHGTRDTENPPAATHAAASRLQRAGRLNVTFRWHEGVGHEVPPNVADGDWWREWLFEGRREFQRDNHE